MKKISIFLCTLITIGLVVSCAKNNKEDILAGSDPCEATDPSYTQDIKPIMDQFCSSSGCHNSTSVAGGYNLDNHASLQTAALGTRFSGSINHEAGFSKMPKGGVKLTECQLLKIENWINEGAKNN